MAKKNKEWPKEIIDSVYGKIVFDDSVITARGYLCGRWDRYGWITHHYEPRSDRSLGIWPTDERLYNLTRLQELKSKWGFTYILFPYPNQTTMWNTILQAGFDESTTMIALTPYSLAEREIYMEYYGDVFAYYVGEPGDQTQYNYSIDGVKNGIISSQYSSLFVIDGFKKTVYFDLLATMADRVMFSSYKHWWWEPFSGTWVSWPVDPDQRTDWTQFKVSYGSKFSMTWIGAHDDLLEYGDLLVHARALSLNPVWLFQAMDGTDVYSNNNIETFCEKAFINGYLKKVEQYVCVEWRCDDGCDCDRNNPDQWYPGPIYTFNTFRTLE